MTSRTRAAVDGDSNEQSWMSYLSGLCSAFIGYSIPRAQMIFSYARHIGWFVIVTGMITALPLIFEVKRESMMEEMEMAQIQQGIAEGKTPQELAMQGLTAAVEPKVL